MSEACCDPASSCAGVGGSVSHSICRTGVSVQTSCEFTWVDVLLTRSAAAPSSLQSARRPSLPYDIDRPLLWSRCLADNSCCATSFTLRRCKSKRKVNINLYGVIEFKKYAFLWKCENSCSSTWLLSLPRNSLTNFKLRNLSTSVLIFLRWNWSAAQ